VILDSGLPGVKKYLTEDCAHAEASQQKTTLLLANGKQSCMYRALLLDSAGGLRKDSIGVAADKTYGAYNQDQNYCQHYSVLGDILALLV
jgi:hypothetical protein